MLILMHKSKDKFLKLSKLWCFIMESDEQNQDLERKVTVENLNIEILPIIYEIIRSVEKDHHDNTAKTRESQDCSQKVLELQKRLDQARAEIRMLPGIDYSKEQQLHHLEALKTQLKLKQELLRKYRYMYTFEIPK
ncbi:mediator of RNA polymerase II transcription subunit 9 [Zophobas morio]